VGIGTDGRILAWNPAAERLFGWPATKAMGALASDLLAGANPPALRSGIAATVVSGATWRGDVRVAVPESTSREVYVIVTPSLDEDGRIRGVVLSAEELAERRARERQVQEVADRLDLALTAGELGTWRWDQGEGRVVWDERLHALYGLEPGTFPGTYEAWRATLHPDDREAVEAEIAQAMRDRAPYQLEHRILRADGSVRWVHGQGLVVVDDDGEALGTTGCVADITDRKEAEFEAERRARVAGDIAAHERGQRERLAFLVQLSDAAVAAADHDDFMQRVVEAAVPTLGDWCVLHYHPERSRPPYVAVGHRDPARASWAHDAITRHPDGPAVATGIDEAMLAGEVRFAASPSDGHGGAVHRVSPEDEIDDVRRRLVDRLAPTSTITVPLITKRGVVGAAQLVMAESGRHYVEEDVALVQAAAGRIANALDDLWQADQQRRIAATLQAALLPPALPTIPGIDVAVRYWAAGASDVGGDFYDVFRVDDTRWSLLIGDVCGTGADAAAVTSIARHTVRAAARHGHDHRDVLRWLNEAILQSDRGLFATACYATLERSPRGWALRCAAGGHPLPVLVRASGSAEQIEARGTLLGVFEEIRSHPIETALEPGDTVVLYTDGVTDLPAPYGMSEPELVDAVVRAAQTRTADDVAEEMRRLIAERQPIANRTDDIALVVLRLL